MRIWILGCVAVSLLVVESSRAAEQSGVEALVDEGVTLTFQGRRDEADRVWARLRAEHPDDPAGWVFQVDTLWWRVMFDEGDVQHDDAIASYSQEAIRLAEARLAAHPNDARAHYYAGRALIHQGRLDGIRGRFLSAGTAGEEGRPHLERAVQLDPKLIGARYPLGLYYYYADLVTRWFKWLQWLWFVPSGDGPTGLRYIESAAERHGIHQHDAQFVLADISMEFPPLRVDRAETLMDELYAKFPDNTLIHYQLIDARFTAGKYDDVIAESYALESTSGGDALDDTIRGMAPLWRARAHLALGDSKRAEETLGRFPPEGPQRPHWGTAWVGVTKAQLLDSIGKRSEAEEEYRRVADLERPYGSRKAALLAEEGLERPYVPPTGFP